MCFFIYILGGVESACCLARAPAHLCTCVITPNLANLGPPRGRPRRGPSSPTMLIQPPPGPFSRRERLLAGIATVNVFLAIAAGVAAVQSSGVVVERLQADPSSFHVVFKTYLASAKFIDLTHPIAPGMPLWEAFDKEAFRVGPATAGSDGGLGPAFAARGDPFTYGTRGFVSSSYTLPTDQLGTQLDPPAHWNEYGATITDIPPTVSLCPLVVVDITAQARCAHTLRMHAVRMPCAHTVRMLCACCAHAVCMPCARQHLVPRPGCGGAPVPRAGVRHRGVGGGPRLGLA